jgi:hypothetical protein
MAVVFVLAVVGVVFFNRRDDGKPLFGRGVQNPMYAVSMSADAVNAAITDGVQNPMYAVSMNADAVDADGTTYAYLTAPTTEGNTTATVEGMPNLHCDGGTVYAVPMSANDVDATYATPALPCIAADPARGPTSYASRRVTQRRDNRGPPPLRKSTGEDDTVTAATSVRRATQRLRASAESSSPASSYALVPLASSTASSYSAFYYSVPYAENDYDCGLPLAPASAQLAPAVEQQPHVHGRPAGALKGRLATRINGSSNSGVAGGISRGAKQLLPVQSRIHTNGAYQVDI